MKRTGWWQWIGLALMLGGCVSLGDSPATRFYVLTPLTDSATPPDAAGADAKSQPRVSIGVDPVAIPRYLDRPQIVTRLSANELSLAEFDQWAEPLPDSVTHVLAENLTRLLSVQSMDIVPDPRANRSDFQVEVTLSRFECEAGQACVLQARWTLVDERDGAVRAQNPGFEVQMEPEDASYDAIAGTLSRALGALSREIALHVRAVVAHGGTG